MRTRMIFSSQNNHQVDRRGAVVLSKVPLPLLHPENVPVTDAESGRGGRIRTIFTADLVFVTGML